MKKSKAILDKGFLNISVKPLMPPKVREHKSNCRSKLSMHLNSLFPEKDKDTDLRIETLKMKNSLAGVFFCLISITKLSHFVITVENLHNF